jgi:hypothetical protein
LGKLSFASIASVLIAVLSMSGLSIYYMNNDKGCQTSTPDKGSCDIVYFDIAAVLGHVGAATIAFEGANGLVVNVRSECKNIEKYPKILFWAIFSVYFIEQLFATLTYYTFVGQTEDILVLNYEVTPFTIFIIICVCFNTLCSYPI